MDVIVESPCDDEQMMEWKKRITQLEDDLEVRLLTLL